jgi:hypothetical protein
MTTGSVTTGTAASGTADSGSTATGSTATGNGALTDTGRGVDADVRDGSKQLRDIEELVAKLAIVTKQLAFPARTMPSPRYADAGQPAAHDN